MRVSDDRYTRDLERLGLAQRLIRHEARTFTIRQWTGLTEDRIRKLYRSYVLSQGGTRIVRHRGKSPRQVAFFFKNTELNFQAAQVASQFVTFGLLRRSSTGIESGYRVGSIESGTQLCRAYESFLDLNAPVDISFEHAWYLLGALSRHDELSLVRCTACGGLRVRDLLARRRLACANCESVGIRVP